MLANKVVLCFESEFSTQDVWIWLRAYNQKSVTPLTLCDELPNAVFVVQFMAVDLGAVKQALLAASPLGANEIYASVNDFTCNLDPCNIKDFKHLVTVNIVQGDCELFGIVDFLTNDIGSFVKAHLGSDNKFISVVVESTLKLFPARQQFELGDLEVRTVQFDYIGRNLRCCYCFSYRHLAPLCRRPKPSYFLSPDLEVDAVEAHVSSSRGGQQGREEAAAVGVTPSTDKRHRYRQRYNTGHNTSSVTEDGLVKDTVEFVTGDPSTFFTPAPVGAGSGRRLPKKKKNSCIVNTTPAAGILGSCPGETIAEELPSQDTTIPEKISDTSGGAEVSGLWTEPPLDSAPAPGCNEVGESSGAQLAIEVYNEFSRKRQKPDLPGEEIVSYKGKEICHGSPRPSKRVFRPTCLDTVLGDSVECLPMICHEALTPLLLQCARPCISDSQSPR